MVYVCIFAEKLVLEKAKEDRKGAAWVVECTFSVHNTPQPVIKHIKK
jgi:hypothetical protein